MFIITDGTKHGITYGRRQLFSDYTTVTERNVLEILGQAFPAHLENVTEIAYLRRYEKGEQPILNRIKKIRPDINNRIVENNAHVAARFTVGYRYGQPISYVQRSKKDIDSATMPETSSGEQDEQGVGFLNEMMFEQGKSAKDVQMAGNFIISGTGFRMVLPNRNYGEDDISPFEIMILNPLSSFVVYTNDAYREPLLGVSYTKLINGGFRFGAYSKTQEFVVDQNVIEDPRTKEEKRVWGELYVKDNPIGEIPIIEYINDYERMGIFERAIPVLDALNLATSDRLNDIAQHVQSLLWLHNAEIDEEDKENLKNNGIILTKNNDGLQANIKYLESILDQTATQNLVDYLYEQFLQLTGIPGREQSTGGNTGAAIMLSNGWQLAESYANTSDLIFDESEKRFLRVVLKICRMFKDVPAQVKNLRLSDIEIHHGRKKDYELVNKANALSTLLNAGVDGNTAFTTINLFPDSQQAWNDSKEVVEAIQKKLASDIQTQQESVTNESVSENSASADLESGYSDKTASALVSGIVNALKPMQDKIDSAIEGYSNGNG